MSVKVGVESEAVDVHIDGMDKVWALRRRLELPLGRITSVRVDDATTLRADLRWRVAGTGLGRIASAGIFRGRDAKKQFWVAFKAPRLLAIELGGSIYDRVVLQVDDPDRIAHSIEQALTARST